MRRLLDGMYGLSEAIAAVFIAAICLTVLIQVTFNLIDKVTVAFGGIAPGLVLPSYSEFTGYFLAAATFFALAGSLRHSAHIRVTLLISRLSPVVRRGIEIWCTAVGAAMTGYFAFWSANLVRESIEFNDVSPGIIPVPIWIPQTAMVVGLAFMTIAFIEAFIQAIRGEQPHYVQAEKESDE